MPYVSSGYDFRPRHNMSYSPCAQYKIWLRPRIEASHTGACHKYWFRNTNIPKAIFVTRAGAIRISFALIYNIFLNYLKFMEITDRFFRYTEYRYTVAKSLDHRAGRYWKMHARVKKCRPRAPGPALISNTGSMGLFIQTGYADWCNVKIK